MREDYRYFIDIVNKDALFLIGMLVSKVPLQCGVEVMTEDYGNFTDIAFDMLLATSTHNFRTQF